MEAQYPDAPEIGFGQWMMIGVPLMLVMLPITWFMLTRVLFPLHRMEETRTGAQIVAERLDALGPPSRGEWSVAKNGYVQGRPAWFSCRSACYLASGRPVIVQDTGFGDVLPVGEGLLSFSDLEGAASAIEQESNQRRHVRP